MVYSIHSSRNCYQIFLYLCCICLQFLFDWILKNLNLNNFKNGNLNVLVSCTALDEGFDMPEADGAMILSASSSKRQRIQRMGRVLRITANKQNALIVTVYSSKTEFDKLREESNRYKLEGVPVKWQMMKS